MLAKRGSVMALPEDEEAFKPFGAFCFDGGIIMVEKILRGGKCAVEMSW